MSGSLFKANKSNTIIMSAIIAVLIFFFLTGQPMEQLPWENGFTVGVFSPTEYNNLSYIQTGELARAKINDYCTENGVPVVFNFLYECADGDPDKAVEITERFHSKGVDVMVGYGFGSMLDAADGYSRDIGVVVVSPTGTNIHRGVYPHIFTMGPTVSTEARAFSWLVDYLNVTRLVVFKRYSSGDYSPFIDGLLDNAGSGIIVETVQYAVSSSYTVDPKYIMNLEAAVNMSSLSGDTGVLYLGETELYSVMSSASASEVLSGVNWFASYDSYLPQQFIQDITPKGENDVNVYMLRSATLNNSEYNRLTSLFEETYGDSDSRFQPYLYDSLWVTALTIIEAGTTDNETIISKLPAKAANFYGATGRCQLDSYNQRFSSEYDILCYSLQEDAFILSTCGTVNSNQSITLSANPTPNKP